VEAWFGGVESGEVFDVGGCGWDGDGSGNDMVWVSWNGLEDVKVVESEFEVWWKVVGPEVIVGRTRDDVSVGVIRVDGWFGECEVVRVVVKEGGVSSKLTNKAIEVVVVKVLWIA
jgi:hypothetical protein